MTRKELTQNPNTECACGCGNNADAVIDGFADEPQFNVMDLRGEPFSTSCAVFRLGVTTEQALTEWGIRVRKRKALISAATTEPKKNDKEQTTMNDLTQNEKDLIAVTRATAAALKRQSTYHRGNMMASAAIAVGRSTGQGSDTEENIALVIASCIANLRALLDANFPGQDHDAAIATAIEEVHSERTRAWIEKQKATAA